MKGMPVAHGRGRHRPVRAGPGGWVPLQGAIAGLPAGAGSCLSHGVIDLDRPCGPIGARRCKGGSGAVWKVEIDTICPLLDPINARAMAVQAAWPRRRSRRRA